MKIDELINKYLDGETSPNEEKLLRELIEQDKSHRYEEIKLMLNGFDDLHNLSANFTHLPSQNNMEINKNNFLNKKIFNIKLYYYLAAAVVIIVSALTITILRNSEQGMIITDANVKENVDFTKKEMGNAFSLVSDKVDEAFERTLIIDDATRKMNLIYKLHLINKYLNK